MTSSAWRLPAGSRWPPSMTACHGCLVPMCWAGSQGGFAHSAISSAEVAVAACRWRHEEWAAGGVSSWKDSAKSIGAPKHGVSEPRSPQQACIDEIDFDADAHPEDDPQ